LRDRARHSESGIQSVDRALRMLAAFQAEGEVLTVGDFEALLAVHKSTASRLAATLVTAGFLERAPRGEGLRLGPQVARLGWLASGGNLATLAQPTIDDLAARTGETVVLSVAAGTEAIEVAQATSRHVLSANGWVGRRTPLHASSDGKVLLAFGAGALPDGPLLARTERTVTDRHGLAAELEAVRQAGWAASIGEWEQTLNGVAAPVFNPAGVCVAALNVGGPEFRVPQSRLSELALQCVASANAIGRRLGRPFEPPAAEEEPE
jgi:DNA-binding IclR family transcriptional regulator